MRTWFFGEPTRIEVGGWQLDVDVEGTRREYALLEAGGAESCGCGWCRNFAIIRDEVYPEEFKALLEKLGIDWRRESEVVAMDRDDHVEYWGWFHFLGQIVSEPAEPLSGVPIGNGVGFWFSSRGEPGPWSLLDGITVQFVGVRGRRVLEGL